MKGNLCHLVAYVAEVLSPGGKFPGSYAQRRQYVSITQNHPWSVRIGRVSLEVIWKSLNRGAQETAGELTNKWRVILKMIISSSKKLYSRMTTLSKVS